MEQSSSQEWSRGGPWGLEGQSSSFTVGSVQWGLCWPWPEPFLGCGEDITRARQKREWGWKHGSGCEEPSSTEGPGGLIQNLLDIQCSAHRLSGEPSSPGLQWKRSISQQGFTELLSHFYAWLGTKT